MTQAKPQTILAIDDDPAALDSLREVLENEGYRVLAATGGQAGLGWLQTEELDLVVTDLRMQDLDGLKVLEAVKSSGKEIPVIVMTAFASMETTIDAIRKGAFDYLSKPFKLEQLRLVVGRALEQVRLRQENRRLRTLVEKKRDLPELVGRSPEMVEIYKLIAKVASLDTTVLIQGESGTGKEIVAHLIHTNSGRSGPFLAVNCGALSEGLLESELFGHVRGAFTGAVSNKTGLFEAAQNGTCFLDEITNTPLSLQMKLLRVLQEKEVTKVGSTEKIPVNARVVAAANQPLDMLVRDHLFREDLYYRLKVITLNLPALRERRGDIPLLLEHFVNQFAGAVGREMAIHASVYPVLSSYAWPGNIRELSHAVERAVTLNTSGILTLQDFDELPQPRPALAASPGPSLSPILSLVEKEKEYILEVLAKTNQNISQAAELLQIDRRTISRILKRNGSNDADEG